MSEPGERWRRIRKSDLWGCGAGLSVVIVLPLLRAAARRDTRVAPAPDQPEVHLHSGLFLEYGLLALAPALIAAIAGRGLRWLNVTAVMVIGLIAVGCEVFVSSFDGFTF